ncbi:MAG: disulfide bond formation protein B [Alphaproteobacteria bacterium]|nr:disulfide bond formation protein B [Alphaproteobacteria bacterium]
MNSLNPEQGENGQPVNREWHWLFLAWLIALIATLGALFIGEVLGQTPCLLCWYQRIAMFPLAVILGVASLANDRHVWRYSLPLAAIGGLIALWHSLLYVGIIPEAIQPCTRGGPSCTSADMTLFGIVPLPLLSFGSFIAISILLIIVRRKDNS